MTAIVIVPLVVERLQAAQQIASTTVTTPTLHHGGHGGTILYKKGLDLRVLRVLCGGEVLTRGGQVFVKGVLLQS
jgi:hypothetical protein